MDHKSFPLKMASVISSSSHHSKYNIAELRKFKLDQ